MNQREIDVALLTNLNNLVNELQSTKKTNDKIKILGDHKELEPIIKRVFDKNIKTGITSAGLKKHESKKNNGNVTIGLYEIFDNLADRSITGNEAKNIVLSYVDSLPKEIQSIAKSVFTKAIRIRMSTKTLNKVFPNLLSDFKVMLATDYDKKLFDKNMEEHDKLEVPCYISRKIDGIRLCVKITPLMDKLNIMYYSRAGKTISSLSKLNDDINKACKDLKEPIMLDGEVVALDEKGAENFKLTVSSVRSLSEMKNPRYKVFDIITDNNPIYSDRLNVLNKLFADSKCNHIEILEHVPYSENIMNMMIQKEKDAGGEGLMLRFNHKWEPKRSHYLLKYKFFIVEEFKVKSITIESMPFNNDSGGEEFCKAMKNAIIEYNGNDVSVGSGWNYTERKKYAESPNELIGKIISVRYQEVFTDEVTKKQSLRCPTFRAIIGEKREF